MNAQLIEKLIVFGQAYGPWAVVGLVVAWLAYLTIKKGFSLTVQWTSDESDEPRGFTHKSTVA